MSNMNILKEEVFNFELDIELNNINTFDSINGKCITEKAYVSKTHITVLRGLNESVCIINPFQVVLNCRYDGYVDKIVLSYVSKQFNFTVTESQDIARLYHSIKEAVEMHLNDYMYQLFSTELCNFYKPFDFAKQGQFYNKASTIGHINYPMIMNILKSCDTPNIYKGFSISLKIL